MTLNAQRTGSTEEPPRWPTMAPWLRKWVRLLLAGNPFFIASAALLLLGINRLAVDPSFLRVEETKLLFNFSALQLYELLLAALTVFLAGRAFFYDSTLLVAIESIVLLVPFMLVTQAALIDRRLALLLCGCGAGLVVIRFTALKRWFSELNLPGRCLCLLGILVLLNSAAPLLLRHYVELGGSDAWETPYQIGWMIVLPVAMLLGSIIPAREPSKAAPGRPWLPLLFFTLWATGTAAHFWCLGYVAEREFHLFLLTPFIWAACSVAHTRADLFGKALSLYLKPTLEIASVAVILLAATAADSRLFFVLAILNSAMLVASRQRSQVTGVLLAVSAAMAVAGWPVEWTPAWIRFLDRAKCIELGVAGLIIGLSVKSPGPVIAVCAALVAGLCPRILWPALSGQLSIELGLVFLLLQSLRWEGSKLEKLRTVTAATWIVHAFGWTYAGGTISGWSVSSAAVIVLLVYPVILYLTPAAKSRLIPWSALLVLCSAPVSSVARWLQAASPGLVALLLSFALLGVGTWFALSRKRLAGTTGFAG